MSMIGSLIDELNKSADEWNGSNMFELARMCREAADTIWQLRDDLQRANDAVRDAEHDESMAWDRVRKAEAENAKLRESVKRLMTQRDERLARAETENAKLRQLVEDMLDCIQIRAAFSRPPTEEMYEMFYKRTRELGVDE